MAPRTVSVVNMKGGVGKSTTVASLAEALSAEGLRVLVIDLDPQSNVSMMLAGQDRWIELRQAEQTIDEYFNQYVYGGEPRFFRDFIANKVSDIAGDPAARPADLDAGVPLYRAACAGEVGEPGLRYPAAQHALLAADPFGDRECGRQL